MVLLVGMICVSGGRFWVEKIDGEFLVGIVLGEVLVWVGFVFML